jgi:hypothetical protein
MKLTITTTRTGPTFSQSTTFPVKCPKCGHKSTHSLSRLKTNSSSTVSLTRRRGLSAVCMCLPLSGYMPLPVTGEIH